ncbi:serine hydrolase domain-containing protein [Paenibacillus sp. RC67]|uniref:serine hydrolase domain-containing protein n=1 Tax=Paenibacillus sp. RC67 TaxID=3039392 RepID=UPI0024AE142F|nr:serine hydrolase domain-containing protein [Paenibacillus sp. RC67]
MELEIQPNPLFDPLVVHVEQTRDAIKATASAVVVIQNDRIVTEWYSGYHHDQHGALPVTSDSQFNVYSIRKTHIALALAFAIMDAGLDLNTPINPYIEDIPHDEIKEITLSNVLTKTKPKFFGAEKVEGEGLAARIIKGITGQTISQVITGKVLEPMQLKNTQWIAIPKEGLVCDFTAGDGHASVRLGSNEGHDRNLYMSTKDLAYWGYLFLNNGNVNGQQIIPNSIFQLSQALRTAPGNATKRIMGWYYNEDLFEAYGATGCHVVVIPKYNTVAVRMYNQYATEHTETLLKCLQQNPSISTAR